MKLWVMLICIALTGCSMSADTKLAEKAVSTFHEMLDAKQFQAIYDQSAGGLKEVVKKQDFVALVDAVHRKLGATKSITLQSKSINYSPSGALITLFYDTAFVEGEATEQFDYQIQGDDAYLIGYHINSNTLITN